MVRSPDSRNVQTLHKEADCSGKDAQLGTKEQHMDRASHHCHDDKQGDGVTIGLVQGIGKFPLSSSSQRVTDLDLAFSPGHLATWRRYMRAACSWST